MAVTTAADQIYAALRLIGQLAEGEQPSADTAQDALTAMNQMIDSWNTERLSVFSTQDQVFTWEAGAIKKTLGPTGNFVGNRPILVDDATYYDMQVFTWLPGSTHTVGAMSIHIKDILAVTDPRSYSLKVQ